MTDKSDKDPDSIYDAIYENMIRLEYWIYRVYWQHGLRDSSHIGNPALTQFENTPSEESSPVVSVRYIILELWNFNELYKHGYDVVMEELDLEDLEGLRRIIKGFNKEKKLICRMRNKFAVHADWTFNEATEEINKVGLHSIMRYALTVRLFQDMAFRVLSPRYLQGATATPQLPSVSMTLGCADDIKLLNAKYSDTKIPDDIICGDDKYQVLYDSFVCLGSLYAHFNKCGRKTNPLIPKTHAQFGYAFYNIKYMILEMHNIIQFYSDMNVSPPFKPEFLKREPKYHNIRDHYCAHSDLKTIKSLAHLLETNGILLSKLTYDIDEITAIFLKLYDIFPQQRLWDMRFMTETEIRDIDYEIRHKLNSCLKFYHGEFSNDVIQKIHDVCDRTKKNFGLS